MRLPPARDGLAAMLRMSREHAGLTVRDVEARAGVNKSMLSRLETGTLTNPTLRVMRALTKLYGIPPGWWFE